MPTPDNPKILYILSQLGQGGAQQQLHYLLTCLQPNATILALAPGGFWLKPFQDMGYPVIELQRSGSFELNRLRSVMRVIREQQPDIVHVWTDGIPGAYGRLATQLLRFRPVIVGIRGYPARDPAWFSHMRRLWLNRHITLFVSNAVASQEYMIHHDGVPRDKSRFIPNGIELHRFTAHPSNESRSLLPEDWRDKIIVGTVGALNERKSPDVYVRVARQVIDQNPNVRFLHAGDGSRKESVMQLSRELGVDPYILFLGSRDDVPNVLAAMDIFVLTSNTEGTPNAIMEAMAAGLPCVTTDVGDCKTLVSEGQNGFITPVGDVDALAGHILRLAANPELRGQMGRTGYERIQPYGVQQMAQQYQALYQEVLANK